MPLDLGAVNAVNAVMFVPIDSAWRARAKSWLTGLGAVPHAIEAWLDVLDRRAAGVHDWREELAGATFPDGRPMPPVRPYNDALQQVEAAAPVVRMWSRGTLPFALDVWGPGERGGERDTLGLELLVHRTVLEDTGAAGTGPDARAERRAVIGDAFAALMAEACEVFEPVFALSDGMQPVSDFLARATPERVRHPAPAGARLADYAWALAYWSPARLDEDLAARLARIETPPPPRAALVPDGVDVSVRTLATGGAFLRARRILGAEQRGSRARLETPLAKQLGLHSNHLLYKH